MQSFVISSRSEEKIQAYIAALLKKHAVHKLDVYKIVIEKTIGIDEIRTFQKTIFLKPFKSTTKAGIIHNAESLTHASQNALLKLLEEPPPHTLLILTTKNKGRLLPTILSRVSIIELANDSVFKPNDALFTKLFSQTLSQKLKHAQDLAKTKEGTLLWLEEILQVSQTHLSQENPQLPKSAMLQTIRLLQETHTTLLTTNTNPRLALERLLLKLPSV